MIFSKFMSEKSEEIWVLSSSYSYVIVVISSESPIGASRSGTHFCAVNHLSGSYGLWHVLWFLVFKLPNRNNRSDTYADLCENTLWMCLNVEIDPFFWDTLPLPHVLLFPLVGNRFGFGSSIYRRKEVFTGVGLDVVRRGSLVPSSSVPQGCLLFCYRCKSAGFLD